MKWKRISGTATAVLLAAWFWAEPLPAQKIHVLLVADNMQLLSHFRG